MLNIPLKKEYFDMITKDKKTKEYRKANDYWSKRISKLYIGDFFTVSLGYTNQKILLIFKGYKIIRHRDLPIYVKDFFFDNDYYEKNYLEFYYEISFKKHEVINV